MNVLDSFSLKGKVALVTGGAGRLGKQIVLALAQAGARTYMTSRDISSLEKAAESYRSEGLDVFAEALDQGDECSTLSLKKKIFDREDKVDILVNNAVARTMGGWNDDASKFMESMRVNATGLFIITRAFGDEMAQRRSGTIINIGSTNGMTGPDPNIYMDTGVHGYIPDYNFHKGAMVNFTRFISSYYGSKNVRCNCLSPVGFENENTPVKFSMNYKQRIYLGRMLNSTDLMGSVVFLASDASAFITGVNIPVDGGYTAR